jgi:hypothetical protein
MNRRDFLAAAVGITILPTEQDGVSRIIAADKIAQDTPPSPTSGEYVTTPEAHGWRDGNSVEQNSDALRRALAAASASAASSTTGRGVVELTRKKIYIVRPNGDANGAAALPFNSTLQNVEVRTRGKPSIGSGNQATLRIESWAGKTGMYKRSVVSISSGRNLLLGWLRIDGNKFSIGGNVNLRRINYTAGGENGGLHCIRIDGCNNVTLRQVEAFNALTDALRIDKNGSGDLCRGLLIEDCNFHHSRRQALSLIAAGNPAGGYGQVIFRRTKFRWTGDDTGLAGEAPGANIDFEPTNQNDGIDGITFEDCDSEDCQGSSYGHGSPGSKTAGRGFVFDSRAGHVATKIRFRNFRVRRTGGSVGDAFVLVRRCPVQ